MDDQTVLKVGICNVVYVQAGGVALPADTKTVSERTKNVWKECKKGKTEEEIYNPNETGLFYT